MTELDAASMAFISVDDNIDLATAQGGLMVQLLAPFAEFERA